MAKTKKEKKKVNKSSAKSKAESFSKAVKKVVKKKAAAKKSAKAAPSAKASLVSPLAPNPPLSELPAIEGVSVAAIGTGIKYKNRDDVMLVKLCAGSSVAGVFTRSATRSAPVLDCQDKIDKPAGDAEAAILVNAGNSNAFTGSHGSATVDIICDAVSGITGVPKSRVFTASTGVIGAPLDHSKITNALEDLNAGLAPENLVAGARAIMTTDTFAKGSSRVVDIAGTPVTIAGIAKGSGMIAPDMATMLVYIFTDAAIPQAPLQRLVARLCTSTFNAITVDGDTSTSDTLMVAATGKSGAPVITDLRSRNGKDFSEALHAVMLDLAHQVVRDGEGATKFVAVNVTGAVSDRDARKVASSIANSPLVKTAIAGQDANWGRVVMAVGKSGAQADRDLLSIRFGDILVAEKGWVAEGYSEEKGAAYMKNQDLAINVDLGLGSGAATMWTCDLTHQYISINGDYRS